MKIDVRKKKILAIDDEPIIIRISEKFLTAEGFEVDVACNGLVAKEMISKKEYDFYLSDIRTPAMNGMQFYEYLCQQHPGQERKIIFTTGDVMSLDVRNFLNMRTNLFLAKPFTPDDLRYVIRKAVALSPKTNAF
jgi:CheY-like chemotaxis protein